MKLIQKLILLFSVFVIVFGFYQLQHEQDIFAQSRMRCCNNGQCKGADCSAPSSIDWGVNCEKRYYLTCQDCLNMEGAGLLDNCLNTPNEYCNEDK